MSHICQTTCNACLLPLFFPSNPIFLLLLCIGNTVSVPGFASKWGAPTCLEHNIQPDDRMPSGKTIGCRISYHAFNTLSPRLLLNYKHYIEQRKVPHVHVLYIHKLYNARYVPHRVRSSTSCAEYIHGCTMAHMPEVGNDFLGALNFMVFYLKWVPMGV